MAIKDSNDMNLCYKLDENNLIKENDKNIIFLEIDTLY